MPGLAPALCRPSVLRGSRRQSRKRSKMSYLVNAPGATKGVPSLEMACFGCGNVTKYTWRCAGAPTSSSKSTGPQRFLPKDGRLAPEEPDDGRQQWHAGARLLRGSPEVWWLRAKVQLHLRQTQLRHWVWTEDLPRRALTQSQRLDASGLSFGRSRGEGPGRTRRTRSRLLASLTTGRY